jgi:hypothetical protein
MAIALQLVLLVFHQLTTALDFYPFNGVRHTKLTERRVEQAVNGLLMGLPPIGFIFHIDPLIYYGVAYYFILLSVECATWWMPYFFGASDRWLEIYLRVHSSTVGVLPGRDKRTAPNLEHLILMALTAATAEITLVQFRALHPEGYPRCWIPIVIGILSFCGTSLQQMKNEKPRRSA